MERKIDEDGGMYVQVWAGDRVIRYNSIKFLKEREEKRIRSIDKKMSKRLFAKVFINASDILGDENLSSGEYAVLMKLFRYIAYDSCILKYENGKDLNLNGIKSICSSISERTVENSIKKLLERGILAVGKNGKANVYIVNPYIFFRGTVPDDMTEEIFSETKWANLYKEVIEDEN